MKLITLDFNNYENIIFCGDVHGLDNLKKMFTYNCKDIKDSLIIICGDIGLGFYSPVIEKNIIKDCNEILKLNNNHAILFRGNHDNPNLFKNKSKYNLKYITIIRDYTVLKTKKYNILCIGGGISIDRTNRIPNKSYWNKEIVKNLTDNLKKEIIEYDHIDIIATHNAPTFIPPVNKSINEQGYMVENWSFYDKTLKQDVWNDRQTLNKFYDFIIKHHNIQYWFYGHFHNSYYTEYNNIKFIGLDMFYNIMKTVRYQESKNLIKQIVKYGPDLYDLNDSEKYSNIKEIYN
jgi:Icc-related predicted phosphoesterase